MVAAYRARFLIAGLLALLLALPAAVALADGPHFVRVDIDNTDAVQACGTTLTRHLAGFVLVDEEADGVQVGIHLHGTFANPATGQSLPFVIAETRKFTLNPDGSATVAITGLQGRSTVPGAGLVAADVGRLVLRFASPTAAPEVLFEAGQQGGGPFPALCPYLT